jgi:hypothetical protein
LNISLAILTYSAILNNQTTLAMKQGARNMTTNSHTVTNNTTNHTIHPFEAAGLGIAPFKFAGYRVAKFQACPDAPVQSGSSCDYCGRPIMYVYYVRSSDDKEFHVGCDCIAKVDGDLHKHARHGRWEYEHADEIAAEKARKDAIVAARLQQAQRNLEEHCWTIELCEMVLESTKTGSWEKKVAERALNEINSGYNVQLDDRELEALTNGYFAATLPESSYMGKEKQRARNVKVRYEGGPQFDSMYGIMQLRKFRVLEGPNAGCVLVWKTSVSSECVRRGEETMLTGTVVKHDEYEGIKQTFMNRCKFEG